MKQCNFCLEKKDVSEFSKYDGRMLTKCKDCIRLYNRQRYEDEKEDECEIQKASSEKLKKEMQKAAISWYRKVEEEEEQDKKKAYSEK